MLSGGLNKTGNVNSVSDILVSQLANYRPTAEAVRNLKEAGEIAGFSLATEENGFKKCQVSPRGINPKFFQPYPDRIEASVSCLLAVEKRNAALAGDVLAGLFQQRFGGLEIAGKQGGAQTKRRGQWTREEAVRLFEMLIERGSTLTSSPAFRSRLTRDESLLANQFTREANGNIAYRSVDFKIADDMSDAAFWSRIEETPYNDLIEDNAAAAMVKMAEKLKLVG